MKTVTAVRSTVHHKFENLKTELRPVLTGLNWSFEPQQHAGFESDISVQKYELIF